MNTKTFEIRDINTFIPALAIQLSPANEQERYLMGRLGFGRDANTQSQYIILVWITQGKAEYDPYKWGERTLREAHKHIEANFAQLENGAVIDVEYLLGERDEPKESEAVS